MRDPNPLPAEHGVDHPLGITPPQREVSNFFTVTAEFELVTPVTAVGTSPLFVIVTATSVSFPEVIVIGLAG
jgi:hypothetical protein